MCIPNERRNAAAPLLFALAGVAFLGVALLALWQPHPPVSPLRTGLQLLAPALFFLAAYLQYRRLR
jgi:hypothetical protein